MGRGCTKRTGVQVGAATVILVGMLAGLNSAQRIDTSTRAVVTKAAAHVTDLQKALEFVLADENALQEVFDEEGRRIGRRETVADFFLAFVAGDGGWLSIRDLTSVDGAPVEGRSDLRALLTRGAMARIGRIVADRNARFNIGPVVRNFNDPMLALLILDDGHRDRFRFERRSVATADGATLVTIAFTERERPTLIRGANDAPVFTRGELIVDAATGALRQSIVTMKDGPTSATLTTTFSLVPKLSLWLPSRMVEAYAHRSTDEQTRVSVTSNYGNYRKFEATARIK